MKRLWIIAFVLLSISSFGQSNIELNSSDQKLKENFDWAKKMALSFAHDGKDPVGYWYESALPNREAFCMRDVSHQIIGGELLGLSPHNYNMMEKFAENISESKDWCSYWEINRYNQSAPADYVDDEQFWYNLNANFDVIQACLKLYNWSGNTEYLNNPVFVNFYEKSLNEYVDRWMLSAKDMMMRPRHLNTDVPFDVNKKFNGNRGIPSYEEQIGGFITSADLISTAYAGFKAYADMLTIVGRHKDSGEYAARANEYKKLLNEKWWNNDLQKFETFWGFNATFIQHPGDLYVLWFDVSSTVERKAKVLDLFIEGLPKQNVENLSYVPTILYRLNSAEKAYEVMTSLKDYKRNAYPEVSYGVVEGVVGGVMGVDPRAATNTIRTISQTTDATKWVEVKNIPILGITIDIKHTGKHSSQFKNSGDKSVVWRTAFYGEHSTINVGKKEVKSKIDVDQMGNKYSYADVCVGPGESVLARL